MQVKKQQLELDMEHLTSSKLGEEYVKAGMLSPCLFNLYAEYIMQNVQLNESQAGIKIVRRNINNQIWRRKWQPTPIFLPGKPHGQRSLVGYSPWGRKESDMTEHTVTFVSLNAGDLSGRP